MKHLFIVLLLLIAHISFANMASPIRVGTLSGAAFSSRDIDIVNEKIYLKINPDYKSASYIIEYTIKTESEGKQIPLLFIAKDYGSDFKIWVDSFETKIINIPSTYLSLNNTPFKNFENSFSSSLENGSAQTATIRWNNYSTDDYNFNDLKYFETNLCRGEHHIRVEYIAKAWVDISNWIKKYSFSYSLSPAKNWKSFGALEIILNASALNSAVTTSLGGPVNGKLNSFASWKFSILPADYFVITYVPKISFFAKALITISPLGLTILIALLIAIAHLLIIKKLQVAEPKKNTSRVVTAGVIIAPLLFLISYIISFEFIDGAIGAEAGRHHGYTFLVILLYPILLLIYWLIIRGANGLIKRRIKG